MNIQIQGIITPQSCLPVFAKERTISEDRKKYLSKNNLPIPKSIYLEIEINSFEDLIQENNGIRIILDENHDYYSNKENVAKYIAIGNYKKNQISLEK